MKDRKFTSVYTANIVGMDSRADWLLNFGLHDYIADVKTTLVPFIMNIHDESQVETIARLIEDGQIYIPGMYAQHGNIQANKFFTAFALKSFFDELAIAETMPLKGLREAAKEILLCAPHVSAQPDLRRKGTTGALVEPAFEARTWPDDTVVIGIIDDGIAFGHQQFRHEDRTRVQFFWRQDGLAQNPRTVDYGSELSKYDGNGRSGIDSLLTESTFGGSVDEDSFYHRAGMIDFNEPGASHKAVAWRASHGTHVLDLAAGASPSDMVANRPIICVQLPTTVVADTSGATWRDKVKNGMDYIIQRASLLTGEGESPLPVVINFSFGVLAGPHDGTGIMERDFDQLIASYDKLRIVLPAGNSHLSRCHAHLSFDNQGESIELQWRVQPDDRTSSWLHIWMPNDNLTAPASDQITLQIEEPGGIQTPILGDSNPGAGVTIVDDSGQEICLAINTFEAGQTQRSHFSIRLQPTARLENSEPIIPPRGKPLPIAPSGVWKIKLQNVNLSPDEHVEAWIERDDTVFGYARRGRQSYFDHPCYKRFNAQGVVIEDDPPDACPVQRAGLINAIGTGRETIVIGGVQGKERRVAAYSAGGPVTPAAGTTGHRIGPDALSVSDDSRVHMGVLAAGSRSGSVVALSGTSFAAPRIAREVANDLANGGSGDREFVKNLALLHESSAPPIPPQPTPERGGWGRIVLPNPNIQLPRTDD